MRSYVANIDRISAHIGLITLGDDPRPINHGDVPSKCERMRHIICKLLMTIRTDRQASIHMLMTAFWDLVTISIEAHAENEDTINLFTKNACEAKYDASLALASQIQDPTVRELSLEWIHKIIDEARDMNLRMLLVKKGKRQSALNEANHMKRELIELVDFETRIISGGHVNISTADRERYNTRRQALGEAFHDFTQWAIRAEAEIVEAKRRITRQMVELQQRTTNNFHDLRSTVWAQLHSQPDLELTSDWWFPVDSQLRLGSPDS